MNENLILENFNTYITENSELFEEATSAMSIVTDTVTYDSYSNKLLEGFEESEARRIKGMFDRQREVLLEESASLLGSPDAITYAVTSFPMLVDIYSDPLLSKVVSVYPSNVPTMSIPRLKWISKVIDHLGVVQEIEFPSATQSVRTGHEVIAAAQSANAFTALSLDANNHSQFRLNKRNFKVIQVTLNGDFNQDTTPVDAAVELIAVADARGNFAAEDLTVSLKDVARAAAVDPLNPTQAELDTIAAADGAVLTNFKIQGQINFESGDITWSPIKMVDAVVNAFTAVKVDAKIRIMGVGNGLAVTKARPKQDILDINCDIEDSFEIENIEEVIQDWKSLYNLDIIAQLKGYIKDQIKLNRDFEIADLLESNIPAAKSYGHYKEIDLSTIANATSTSPRSVQDIFKNIIPVLIALQEKIRKSTRFEIKYLVTGIDSAAVLKSMQSFAVKFDGYEGETGFSGEMGSFSKLEVITSHAVGNAYIHLIPKSESLAQSSIVEISHKPLYVITETTDSVKRSFIKSRNWIGIVRNEALGVIKLLGYETALGTV